MRATLATMVCVVATAASAQQSRDSAAALDGAQEFRQVCTRCHALEKARGTGRRSLEQWQATVKRMQSHATGGDKAFGDETANRIVAYLAPERTQTPADQPQPDAGQAQPLVSPVEPEHHGRAELGEALGIVLGLLIVAMIASGLARRKLKRRFRPVHATLAVILGAALAGHVVLLLTEVGPPRSAWHWCGTLGLCALLGTAAGGLLRGRLGRHFLKLHMSGAFLALLLAILHRVLS